MRFSFSARFFCAVQIFSAAKCGARAKKSTMSRLRVAHLPEFHAEFSKFPLDGCESAKSNSPLQRAKFLQGPTCKVLSHKLQNQHLYRF
jgi:hypothetical protein